MNPAKFLRRKTLFQFAETLKGHYFFIPADDPQIIFHTLYIKDLVNINTLKPVFSLYEDKALAGSLCHTVILVLGIVLHHFVHSLYKTLK